ncbi:MAG: CidA/LrgA family protein [Giesbergeria sp.]|uniref:CidA/LrgA family protein n=1 Tax=Giesbergeria sp. TaxID=2818473 RepID=UPI00263811AC|nr:CidA/LrgA family protein [Giesbergeria sp.]MDD2608578.1 CidA/LrgA family protein [Giesbergeria sp.]
MVSGFAWLLVFQLAGEVLVRGLQWPVPGPVVGMLLLLLVLVWRGGPGDNLRQVGQGLLGNLSLLFVPAGVGIMVHGHRIADEWLALVAALLVSTMLTLAVTALVMRACHRPTPDTSKPPEEPAP